MRRLLLAATLAAALAPAAAQATQLCVEVTAPDPVTVVCVPLP